MLARDRQVQEWNGGGEILLYKHIYMEGSKVQWKGIVQGPHEHIHYHHSIQATANVPLFSSYSNDRSMTPSPFHLHLFFYFNSVFYLGQHLCPRSVLFIATEVSPGDSSCQAVAIKLFFYDKAKNRPHRSTYKQHKME